MSKINSSTFRPCCEQLERRELFAVVTPSGSTLHIEGASGGDTVLIRDNGDGDVSIESKGGTFSARNITKISVDMNGKDGVVYEQMGDRTRNMELLVDLGWHNDEFTALIKGDINSGKTLDIFARGNDGSDYLGFAMNGDVDDGALLKVRLHGDELYANPKYPPGDGFANDDDLIGAYFNGGDMDGEFEFSMYGDWGNDHLIANFEFSSSSHGRLSSGPAVFGGVNPARVDGGSGNDTLAFTINGGNNMSVTAKAVGGDGEDTLVHTLNVDVDPDVEEAWWIP